MLFQWAAVTFSIHNPFKVLFFVKKKLDNGTQKAVQRQRMGMLLCEFFFGTFEEEMRA